MKTLFLTLALTAATLTGAANAEPARVATDSTAVSTAGLDLGSAAGVRALDRRILHAASALCGAPSPADARARIAFDRCREDVRANVAAARGRAIEVARRRDAAVIASSTR